ncbi:MAG: RES domain-containing protein [Thermoanaerobacterium thermosaccharolyticum]|jgi:hypothetical protein
MNSMDNINQLWEEFKTNIKYDNRYFPKNKKLINKLHGMLSRLIQLSDGIGEITVFRARIGRYNKEDDIRKPDPQKVNIADGRCNPKGISYFYTANNEETAIYEVRPQINDIVTVGIFKNNDNIRIVDFRTINLIEKEFVIKSIISDEDRTLLDIILTEISKPLNPNEQSLDYIPIQYIVEYIKQYNNNETSFDGFVYESSLKNEGVNYVFFNDAKFDLLDIKYYKTQTSHL